MRLTLACVIALSLFAPFARADDSRDSKDSKELIVWGAWRRKGLDAAFRRFEQEHPGWRVILSSAAGAGEMDPQKLMCGIAGGSPPDTLIQDRLSLGEWAIRDAFLPLDDLIQQSLEDESLARSGSYEKLIKRLERRGPSKQLDLARRLQAEPNRPQIAEQLVALCQGIHSDQFYNACWSEARFNGHVYGIPNTTDVRVLYYNEDLLERAGLVDASGKARPPRDWDELREYTLKLTERDARGNITRLGFAPIYSQGFLYHFGWLNGGEFMSPDARTCTLNSPPIVSALDYIVNIYDSLGGVERVDSFKSTFGAEDLDAFLTGKIAMKIESDFGQTKIADFAPHLRFGVTLMPAAAGNKPVAWSGGFSWAIPAGAKHSEMAFELIRFLMTDRVWRLRAEVESRVASSRGRAFIPEMAPLPLVNLEVYNSFVRDNPDLPERIKRNFLFFTDAMNRSRFRPVTPAGQVLWDAQVRATEQALRHRYTPAEALRRGNATVQTQLDAIFSPRNEAKLNWWYPITGVALLGCAGIAVGVIRSRKSAGRMRGEMLWGYAFAAPWLTGFLVFTAGPIIASVVYSFCRYDVLHDPQYIGAENYRQLFFHDPLFWKSLANTGFMVLGVPLGMIAGLAIAMLLNQQVRGMRAYRTVFYLPAIVPVVASSLLWLWVLNPEVGLLNSLLRMIGVSDPPRWLASPSWLLGSKSAIILMGLWGAGASMIIWLAGLKGIPQHLYESASIDGAGPWRRFWNVTLPMLSPYIFFNLVTGIIGTMQIFAQAYIMTKGGPDDSTMFYAFYLFNSAFRYFRMGYASAMAWVLFVIVLILTLIQLGLGRKWVHYDTV